MARCDTCDRARWDPECVTKVWCEKKKKYIRLDGARHLFVAAGNIRRKVTPTLSNNVTISDVIKT